MQYSYLIWFETIQLVGHYTTQQRMQHEMIHQGHVILHWWTHFIVPTVVASVATNRAGITAENSKRPNTPTVIGVMLRSTIRHGTVTQSHNTQLPCSSGEKKRKGTKWKGKLGGRSACRQVGAPADGGRRAAGIWGMQGALDLTCRAGRRHLSRHHTHLKGAIHTARRSEFTKESEVKWTVQSIHAFYLTWGSRQNERRKQLKYQTVFTLLQCLQREHAGSAWV